MQFDDFLEQKVGSCGRYQKLLVVLLSLIAIFTCMFTMELIFTMGKMPHWCSVPQPQEGPLANLSSEQWLNRTIPWKYKDDQWSRDSCHRYTGNLSLELGYFRNDSIEAMANVSTSTCSEYEYDTSEFKITVVNEFDIVCGKGYYVSLIKSLSLGAKGIGLIGGVISDRFGRKRMMIVACAVLMIGRVFTVFSYNFPLFVTGTVITMLSLTTMYGASFTMCLELVGRSWRAPVGTLLAETYSLGYLILAGLAYLFRDRQTLTLATSIPFLLFIPIIWLAPESPRWLLDTGHPAKANRILRQIARRNGKAFCTEVEFSDIEKIEQQKEERVPVSELIRQICTSWRLVARAVVVALAWFTANMGYYGLTMNIQSLAGSVYVNLAIAGAFEFFSAFFSQMIISSPLGRRGSTSGLYLLSGLSLLLILAVPSDRAVVSTALALFGRTCCSAYFSIIYIWSAELFPTALRSTTLSFASACGKIGGILAPFLAELESVSKVLPMVILGGLSITTGLLLITVPETKGVPLPRTVDDMISRKKSVVEVATPAESALISPAANTEEKIVT